MKPCLESVDVIEYMPEQSQDGYLEVSLRICLDKPFENTGSGSGVLCPLGAHEVFVRNESVTKDSS